jgi:gamma-resorcylate decarboxylase
VRDKWALEEHLSTAENNQLWDNAGEVARNGQQDMDYVESHLLDVDERLRIMDATGIERTIVPLTSPGIQSITDTGLAVKVARDTNDLDDDAYEPLWATVEDLGVPVYLHPREPLPAQQGIYAGYKSLTGSAWGFAHETATHAIRLMLSGLFDRHPGVQVILGHLAEGLPFQLPRLEHRLAKQKDGIGVGSARRTVSEYFSDNFYATTSGHFHTRTLFNTIAGASPRNGWSSTWTLTTPSNRQGNWRRVMSAFGDFGAGPHGRDSGRTAGGPGP